MMEDASLDKFDLILTKEVSRFARNTVDTLTYTRKLTKWGIPIHFITDGIKTDTPDGELRLTIMASMAQDESRKTSTRVKFGQRQSMKKGVVFGNGVLGYDLIDGKLHINEQEAIIIRQIFNSYLVEGKGAYLIAKDFLERQIKSKQGNCKWTEAGVMRMLKNEKYAGILKQQKFITTDYLEHTKKENKGELDFVIIENNHEPIISPSMFEEVQKEIFKRKKQYKIDGSKYSNRYAFSGKLICHSCNERYVGSDNRKRADGTIRKSWHCYTKRKYGLKRKLENGTVIGCNNENVNNEVLKECFQNILLDLKPNKSKVTNDILKAVESIIDNRSSNENKEQELNLEKEKLLLEKSKAINLCVKGIITEKELLRQKQMIEDEMNEIDKKLMEIQSTETGIENKSEILARVKKVIHRIIDCKDFSDEVCKELVDKVVVHNKTRFDFYITVQDNNFFSMGNGSILYKQHIMY